MTVQQRERLREQRHWQIAIAAAVSAGLASDPSEARQKMDLILQEHAQTLKTYWLRELGGGIRSWQYFLRSRGFEETLVVQRIAQTPF